MYCKFAISLTILVVWGSIQADGACTCNVRSNGEYCGTELNRINNNNDCSRNQYMCGPTNRNGQAVIVKNCRQGFECDVSRDGSSNACLIDIDCHCPSGLRSDSRTRYCGSRLTGRDCNPNVVFTCGRSYPNPVDACPNGCSNGRCST